MKPRIILLIVVTFCLATLANAQTSKEVTVFGQKIHYVEAGSGPNVILLHGLGGSTQAWQFNIGPLAEKFHVFVPDQIGFGKSDKPLVNYRIRTYVDFLDQFCKQLKIERATLVGNSMGGWIAAIFAASFPDRVDKADGGLLGADLSGSEGVNVTHPLEAIHRSTMKSQDALRLPGRSRGVDHVGEVLGAHATPRVLRVARGGAPPASVDVHEQPAIAVPSIGQRLLGQ